MPDRLHGYFYCWIGAFATLQLVSPGSVDLETYLASQHIPISVLDIVRHEEGSWCEVRLEDTLYAVLLLPTVSGPIKVTDRKQAIAEQLAAKLGTTQIRFAA